MNGSRAARLVRGWVELYTRGLPEGARAARRDEIDDDLWCHHQEAAIAGRSPRSLSGELLVRLLLGIPSDVSWRLAYRTRGRRAPIERSSSVSVRLFGACALIGGATWGVISIIAAASLPWEPGTLETMLSIIGGVGFGVAAIGLIERFQERLGRLGAFGGASVALGVLTVFGAYPLLVLLPIGSAALAWDLGRIGLLPRTVSVIHVLSSILFLGLGVAVQIDYKSTASNQLLVVLAIPYMLSWIAIGASLLRGVPQTHEPAGA